MEDVFLMQVILWWRKASDGASPYGTYIPQTNLAPKMPVIMMIRPGNSSRSLFESEFISEKVSTNVREFRNLKKNIKPKYKECFYILENTSVNYKRVVFRYISP